MTAVRLRDGIRYGLGLYAYVLGVTILGGAGVGLGAALAWPEVQAWRGPGTAETVVGAGGGVLLFLGLSVFAVGYFGLAFKLLADGVAAGSSSAGTAGPESAAEASTDAAPEPATDPNAGSAPEPEPAAAETGETAGATEGPTETEVGSMGAEEPVAEESPADPPEPSPEEIAFGNSAGEHADTSAETESATTDEPEPTGGSVAGRNAAADPLADPTDDE